MFVAGVRTWRSRPDRASPTPAKRKISCKRRRFFILKHNDLKACMDSKRNERAMHTEMRAGEIQALTVDDLGEDEIYVRRSWSKYDGLKCCKNCEERSVPISISHQLYLKLKMLADFNPHGNGFIFYSTVKDKPMDSKQFNKYLKRALAEIGYADSKDICFHSWKHFFIARILDYVQDKRYAMALSGHKTEAMLNHYGAHLEVENSYSEG